MFYYSVKSRIKDLIVTYWQFPLLLGLTATFCAPNNLIRIPEELTQAISSAQPGDNILMKIGDPFKTKNL